LTQRVGFSGSDSNYSEVHFRTCFFIEATVLLI